MNTIEYIHENYCSNRDVATGNYDCPYATTVVNTICCTGHECNYRGIYEKPVVNNLTKEEMCKLHSGSVYGKTVIDLVVDNSLDDEDDVCLSCPYFNPKAPDCCTYAPEVCYYDTDPDAYPF